MEACIKAGGRSVERSYIVSVSGQSMDACIGESEERVWSGDCAQLHSRDDFVGDGRQNVAV